MTDMIAFDFEGVGIRTTLIDGAPWFVLADVCRVLELDNPRNVTARLDDDEKGVHTMDTPGGPQSFTIINESGLYSLVITSRKPAAKRFKKWVTAEVLPSIRRTGGYTVPGREPPPAEPEAVPYVEMVEVDEPWNDMVRSIVGLSREIRLTRGRSAAQHLWDAQLFDRLGLPRPPLPQASDRRFPYDAEAVNIGQVDRFLSDGVVPDPRSRVRAAVLYDHYAAWCRARDEAPVSENLFGRLMRRAGVEWRKIEGRNWYLGLSIPPGAA